MFWLLALCLSKVQEYSSEELTLLISKNEDILVTCFVNGSESDLAIVEAAAESLQGIATFVLCNNETVKPTPYAKPLGAPSFYVFEGSHILSGFRIPPTAEYFTQLVRNSFTDKYELIDSVEMLKDRLQGFRYSILTTSKQLRNGRAAFIELNKMDLGNQMLVLDPSVFEGIGLEKTLLGVWRTDDRTFASFDRENMTRALIPRVRFLEMYDINKEEDTLVFITTSNYTVEMNEMLIRIHYDFPEFVFGFLGPQYLPISKHAFDVEFENETVQICSFRHRLRYYSADLKIDNEQSIRNALQQIREGRRPGIYVSEPIENANMTSPVKKLVGANYQEFVNQNVDVLVLYMRGGCESCAGFHALLESFAVEAKEANMQLEIGEIDLDKNSEHFPWLPGTPYVILFPARNKSDTAPFRGSRNRDSILLLLEQFGSVKPLPFYGNMPDKMTLQMDLIRIASIVQQMPDDERQKHYAWVKMMTEKVGLDVSRMPGMKPAKLFVEEQYDEL